MKYSVIDHEHSDNPNPPTVAIILATHNPTQSIIRQIDSIYAQVGVQIRIYWGDDRSSDTTRDLIRSLLLKGNHVEISNTKEGATRNFLHLLKYPDEEYIAFSDQDDIWHPEKIIEHIKLLDKSKDLPALSHSNSMLLHKSKIVFKNRVCGNHTFRALSWQNCVQGCTMVINAKAQFLINRLPQEHVVHHDWWIAQVISLCGVIHFNSSADTYYRIHSNNTIGYPRNFRRIINSARRSPGELSRQILELVNFTDESIFLNISEVTTARKFWNQLVFGGLLKRIKVAITDKPARRSRYEDFWRRVMLVFKAP